MWRICFSERHHFYLPRNLGQNTSCDGLAESGIAGGAPGILVVVLGEEIAVHSQLSPAGSYGVVGRKRCVRAREIAVLRQVCNVQLLSGNLFLHFHLALANAGSQELFIARIYSFTISASKSFRK